MFVCFCLHCMPSLKDFFLIQSSAFGPLCLASCNQSTKHLNTLIIPFKMIRTTSFFLITTLQILSFCYISAGSHFASQYDNDHHSQSQHQGTDQYMQHAKAALDSQQGNVKVDAVTTYDVEETLGGLSRLGSKPPNCQHKCKGCVPCDAIQTPANTEDKATMRVFYANYEPEGWKCKCGSSLYEP